MRVFKSKTKNILYLGYRIVSPVFDPIKFAKGIYGYFGYIPDLIKFQRLSKKRMSVIDLFPILYDNTVNTPLDSHYFHQQLWLFENVQNNKPEEHVDVGSTYQMSGYLSKITRTTFVDIRPIDVNLRNLKVIKGDITKLPFSDRSISSLSCLHVLEHIGLGRYGDTLDPEGWKKGCKELERVLSKEGKLYVSVPIGKPKVCFNAHRVYSSEDIINAFDNLVLDSFSLVDDQGNFIDKVSYKDYGNLDYGCGMFTFKRS